MTNLLTVLPEFDTTPFTHVLPSLERALVSAADLLVLDAVDVAKRAQVPPGEVKKLQEALLDRLHANLRDDNGGEPGHAVETSLIGVNTGLHLVDKWSCISTLDESIDATIGGGIAPGYLTELVGESAVGKTQFLLTLLLSVQLPPPHGLGKSALYISTESPLKTTRLTQILKSHPKLSELPTPERPSLSRIQSTHIHDVEAQEHILRYQVPVAIQKQNIGLLVIDSIAANFRAEFDRSKARKSGESFAKRSNQLSQLGALLRDIARKYNVAVVVANQVADRFTTAEQPSQTNPSQRSRPGSPPQSLGGRSTAPSQNVSDSSASSQILSTDDPLALDHQQRFFTGWGDDPAVTNFKTPSLGLTWTNQLATRIALLKEPIYEEKAYQVGEDRNVIGWDRSARAVFSAWGAASKVKFEISEGGIRSVGDKADSNS